MIPILKSARNPPATPSKQITFTLITTLISLNILIENAEKHLISLNKGDACIIVRANEPSRVCL